MEMQYYMVGERRPEWIGHADGNIMEWTESGFSLYSFMRHPSDREVEAFSVESPFEIRFGDHGGVGFFSFKFGSLPWNDAVFSPNLYPNPSAVDDLEEGKGYSLNVLLIDGSNGELVSMRIIGLGNKFSCGFRKWYLESLEKDINRERYNEVIDETFAKYDSKKLADLASFRWKLKL